MFPLDLNNMSPIKWLGELSKSKDFAEVSEWAKRRCALDLLANAARDHLESRTTEGTTPEKAQVTAATRTQALQVRKATRQTWRPLLSVQPGGRTANPGCTAGEDVAESVQRSRRALA